MSTTTFSLTVGQTGMAFFLQNIQPPTGVFTAPPVWTSSDPTTLTLAVAANGLSAVPTTLKPTAAGTTVTVSVTGDGVTSTSVGPIAAPPPTLVTSFDVVLAPAPLPPPPGA